MTKTRPTGDGRRRAPLTGARCQVERGAGCSPSEQSMSQPKPRRSFRGTIAPPHTRKNPTQPDLTPAAKPARAVVWSQPRPQDAPASPREDPDARDDGGATRRHGDRQVQGQEVQAALRLTHCRGLKGTGVLGSTSHRHRLDVSRCACVRACALRRRHPDPPDGYAAAGSEGEDAVPSQPSWPTRAMTRVRGASLIANYKYKYKYRAQRAGMQAWSCFSCPHTGKIPFRRGDPVSGCRSGFEARVIRFSLASHEDPDRSLRVAAYIEAWAQVVKRGARLTPPKLRHWLGWWAPPSARRATYYAARVTPGSSHHRHLSHSSL